MKTRAFAACAVFAGIFVVLFVVLLVVSRRSVPTYVAVEPAAAPSLPTAHDLIDDVLSAGNVRALLAFLEAHPDHARAGEARARIEALRHDDALWSFARSKASRSALETFLADFPGHVREAEARELFATMAPRSVFELLAEGAIEVSARGAGIETLQLELRRRVPHQIAVSIPVGTFFVTEGGAQNMVATRASVVELVHDGSVEARVHVACANRTRPIPHGDDTFRLEASPQSTELQALAPLLERSGASTAVAQAAVWIVTDDADMNALGLLVRSIDGGLSGSRVIDDAAAITALKLCADAGVDVSRRRLGADDRLFVFGLGVRENGIDEWCRQRLEQRSFGSNFGEILVHVLEHVGDDAVTTAAASASKAHARAVRDAGLARLAHSDDAQIRRRAAEVFQALEDPADLELFVEFARDEDLSVRSIAIIALRRFPAEKAFDALARALSDPQEELAFSAVDSILAAPDPRYLPPALALASSERATWLRAHALDLVARLAPSAPARREEIRAAFVNGLRSDDGQLALAALRGLGGEVEQALAPELIAAVRRIDDTPFLVAALPVLHRIGGPAARAEILRLVSSQDFLVVETALVGFASLPPAELARTMDELITSAPPSVALERVAALVQSTRTPEVHAILRRLAAHDESSVRAAALTSLSGWADANDVELLARLAKDADLGVRAAAIRACATLSDATARELVTRALDDPEELVAGAALDACGSKPSESYVPALEAAIAADRLPLMRARLVYTLGAVQTRAAAEALWRLQASAREPDRRVEILEQLGLAADESFLARLTTAAANEAEPRVREALDEAALRVRQRAELAPRNR